MSSESSDHMSAYNFKQSVYGCIMTEIPVTVATHKRVIQAVLGCLPIHEPSLAQEATKIMRIALRVSKCLVAYTTRPTSVLYQPKTFSAVLNSIILTKCLTVNLWENSPYISKQLKGIGPAFSMLLASAGKTTFLLLEESHPRDLERIMNKGPPAGNVLRKQVSLLPKYKLTITPRDRDKIVVELTLLNLAHLAENIENLTAGINHRSYIIVGDSENYLLYLMSFKDTDLIKVYDGLISFEVTRKHSHQHKVLVHCVSSSFAGIDVQSEYLFIDSRPGCHNNTRDSDTSKDISKSLHTEKPKVVDRKRKQNKTLDVTCCKEKIKRNNNLLQNFKYLKESFGKSSKETMGNLYKKTEISNNLSQNVCQVQSSANKKYFESDISIDTTAKDKYSPHIQNDYSTVKDDSLGIQFLEDDEMVNKILTDIENEIGQTTKRNKQVLHEQSSKFPIRKPQKYAKCNYNFINVLQKEIDPDKDNDDHVNRNDVQGFTNTVKFRIDKYLKNAKNSERKYEDFNEFLKVEGEERNIEKNNKAFSNAVEDKFHESSSNNYQNGNSIVKISEMNKCKQNNLPLEDHNSCNTLLPTSSFTYDTDDEKIKIEKQNDRNSGINEKTLFNRDTISEVITENLAMVKLHKPDKEFEIDITNEKQGLLYNDEKLNIEHLKPILTEKMTNDEISATLVVGNNISCLKNTNKEETSLRPLTSQSESSKMPLLCDTADDLYSLSPINNSEQHHAQVEKYSFRTTNFNISTRTDRNQTVKLISNIKIDIDVTKITTTKKEKIGTDQESVFNGSEENLYRNIQFINNQSNTSGEAKVVSNIEPKSETLNNDTSQESIKLETLNVEKEPDNRNLKSETSQDIESIIKKYSKIIRQPVTVDVPVGTQMNIENSTNSAINVPKRKYNIRDLHILEGPLLKEGTGKDSKLMHFNGEMVKGNKNTMRLNCFIKSDEQSSKNCIHFSENQLLVSERPPTQVLYRSKTDFEKNEEDFKQEIPTECYKGLFNLNKTLLNPKLLLESYYDKNDTEEIIPPPPEFADNENDLSSRIETNNAYTPSSSGNDPETYNHCVIIKNPLRKINNNVAGSPEDSLVLPPKEMNLDRWILSSTDHGQDSFLRNPIKNITVIRNSLPDRRNVRLGAFKYKPKNVFKVNKGIK